MIKRVAYLSIHTSPVAPPGIGDAGGMNVYVDGLARTMAARGVQVEVFTGRTGPAAEREIEVADGYRVVNIDTGIPGEGGADRAAVVGEFSEGIVKWAARNDAFYDVAHSHYWLSGWAGILLQEVLGIPFANSFHTLGRVKDANRRADDPPESLLRIAAEAEVIARAGCVVASTPAEAAELMEHYGANPERLCVSPPGVDHRRFRPGDRREARRALGLDEGPLLLFAGRIQPLKGVDVVLQAFEQVVTSRPDARLLVLGGPSGGRGATEVAELEQLAASLAAFPQIEFRPPLDHDRMASAYQAADLVVLPSRSESFGMVAAEAQACGTPVVAARVGGLAYAVADRESGFLVDGWDPAEYAGAALRILDDPAEAARLAAGAVEHARQFSWTATADRLLELYAGIIP